MIPILPNSLNIVGVENEVFRRRRSDLPLEDRLGEYSNAAQVVIGYFQSIATDDLQRLYDPKEAAKIIAAGRVLDAASMELLAKANESIASEVVEMAVATGLLAALANAIYGNFPAAATIAKRFQDLGKVLSPFQVCALCCSAPEHVGRFLALIRDNETAQTFLESLEAFLRTGEATREAVARKAFTALRGLLDTAFDHSVWLTCEICFEQVAKLCIAKVLPGLLGDSSPPYVASLAKAGLKTLLPPQFLALMQDGLLGSNGNAVICLPTSTGKTLLSELCIYAAVKNAGRIGVLVVPYIALGRQIAERAVQHLPDDWKVMRLFGGFKEPTAALNDKKRVLIVATPERLDAMLRFTPDIFSKIDCLVFDEAHMIENGQRGARLEGLIARVLLAQEQWNTGRLVFVSAVIPNVDEIARWIDAQPTSVVRHLWSPNCRRLAIWKANGRLEWYHGTDPVAPEAVSPDDQIASVHLPWPNRIIPTRWNFPEQRFFEEKNYENLVYLCFYMWQREKQPVLCVCSTRETTRRTAATLAARFEDIEPILPATQTAINLVATKYPHYTLLKQALTKGVAYHNASLPHELRAAIEDAAWAKELRCVVSTTTLAEGIDLPFRVTVLADWVRHKGEMQVPYSPLLVRNIAGRCGRVGYFTEGDIVIYDNPIGDRRLKAPGLKEDWQGKIFFSKQDMGIQSAIREEIDDPAVQATIASQFLAAIAENPTSEQIEADFDLHLFSQDGDVKTRGLIDRVSGSLISGEMPFATRNSPLTLTDLGMAVNKSGFSPSSCRRILNCLRLSPSGTSGLSMAVYLLTELGDLPEQGDSKFAKLVDREKQNRLASTGKKVRPPKTYVRLEMLPSILQDWVNGRQPIEIFASLPTVLRSSITPSFAEWLEGIDEITVWDAEFDKFADFLSTTIFEFVPWLLRACSLLYPYSNTRNHFEDWQLLADAIQRDSSITRREDAVGQ